MPKQQNALTCYIHHSLMPELARQGRTFQNGIADLIPIAVPRFKNLPPHEKARYEQMAKNLKKNPSGSGRRDNCGNVIAHRIDPRQQMLQKRKEDRAYLKELFPSGDALLEYKFYIIGFEYMIEVESASGNDYMPVELGIVEWTLRKGVTNTAHKFIDPGDFPLGYRYMCQEHAEETHKIPLEQIKTFDKHYAGIWRLIENTVKAQDGELDIFCMEHEYDKVLGCLTWLLAHAMCGRLFKFKIRFLEDLVLELYARQGKNIAESSIMEMLTTTVFDYDPNTSCKLHEDMECKYCALGTAKRYTYAMSDALSVVYDFRLTENHLPVRTGSTSSYVITGQKLEQPMHESFSQPNMSAGRGYSVLDQDGFAARDIRYSSYGAGNESPALRMSHCASASSYSNLRYANTAVRAPSAQGLPTPAFRDHDDDFVETMSSLSVDDENICRQMSPVVAETPTLASVSSMLNRPSVPLASASDVYQAPSAAASSMSSFSYPVVGRGRGISALYAAPHPGPVGRGFLRVSSSDAVSPGINYVEPPMPRAPPGFGRGAMFY